LGGRLVVAIAELRLTSQSQTAFSSRRRWLWSQTCAVEPSAWRPRATAPYTSGCDWMSKRSCPLRFGITTVLTVVVGSFLHAGLSAIQGNPPPLSVFRVTTTLVQFDAEVLDRVGNPLPWLTRGDFEVLQDGVPVTLKDAIFVGRGSGSAPPTRLDSTSRIAVDPFESEPLVFLIDDMAMTPDGFHRVKRGLYDFIMGGVPRGFEIGILRTGEPGRRTTRLTSSPQLLLPQIRQMRYPARSLRPGLASGSGIAGPTGPDLEHTFVEGTLGSLTSLLADLRRLPGRKVVVLLSEGVAMDLLSQSGIPGAEPVERRMDRLSQLAALAGVTTHCIDVSGVRGAPSSLRVRLSMRNGMREIAAQMGGVYFDAQNDLTPALKRLGAAERGYYLLSYEPPEGTFVEVVPAPFRRIKVRVLIHDATVRTRSGFFGAR
jgi:VWFA-related protein